MSRHDTTASPVSHRPFLFTPFLPSSTQCRRPVTQLRLLFEWTIKRPRGERLSSPDHSISVRSTWSQVVHQPSLLPLSRATRDKENALQADVGDVKGERRKEERKGKEWKAVIVATSWRNIRCIRGVYLVYRPAGDRARITREKRPIITAGQTVYRLPALTARDEEDSAASAAWNPAFFARAPGHASWNPVISSPREGWSPSLSLSLSISSSIASRGSFNADSCRRGPRYFTRDVIRTATTDFTAIPPRGIRSVWRARVKRYEKKGRKKKAF